MSIILRDVQPKNDAVLSFICVYWRHWKQVSNIDTDMLFACCPVFRRYTFKNREEKKKGDTKRGKKLTFHPSSATVKPPNNCTRTHKPSSNSRRAFHSNVLTSRQILTETEPERGREREGERQRADREVH